MKILRIDMENRITLHIATKDRHSEVFGLLQSLRTQTIQNFDIILLDDCSGTPLTYAHFLSSLISRMKLEIKPIPENGLFLSFNEGFHVNSKDY